MELLADARVEVRVNRNNGARAGSRRRVLGFAAVVLAAASALFVLLRRVGTDGPDVPWRLWGRVAQKGDVPPGVIDGPSGIYLAPGGDPLGGNFAYRRTTTPRLPLWRCAGLVLVDPDRGGPSILDRVLRRDSARVASYAPSGVVRDGRPLRWREWVRTFEADEPFSGPADPAVAGAWDVVRGTAAPVRVELSADGAAAGLGGDARWASRDGVLVLRVPDGRVRTGIRYDTIVEAAGVWTGWGDDGAEIRMTRALR